MSDEFQALKEKKLNNLLVNKVFRLSIGPPQFGPTNKTKGPIYKKVTLLVPQIRLIFGRLMFFNINLKSCCLRQWIGYT